MTSPLLTATRGAADRLIAALLGLLVAGINALGIWIPSIWADEGATLSATQRDWPDLWLLLHHIDAVHGTYYAAIKLWLDAVSANSITLRLPSLVASAAVASLTYILAREWFGRTPSVVAAVLCALLPRTTWMAIEGRSWAFSTLVAILSTLAIVRWTERRNSAALLAYWLAITFGIALNIFIVFLIVAHGVSRPTSRTSAEVADLVRGGVWSHRFSSADPASGSQPARTVGQQG